MRVSKGSTVETEVANVFSNLILDVEDLDRSLAFYSGLLHLQIRRQDTWQGHRLAYLDAGPTEILLVQQPKHEQNPMLDRSGGLVLNFRVQNIHEVAKTLTSKNVHVLRGLEEALWGERTLLVADPDGYAVLLTERAETVH